MTTPWILARRHLRVHWLRTTLTVTALIIALFLFCFLIALVRGLDLAVKTAATDRVITQSAVSLFVDLPVDYQPKIAAVPGVEAVTKFQYFGGIYQKQENFVTEFAIDHEIFFDMYRRELEITEGPGGVTGPAARQAAIDAMAADRRACVIGDGLAREFGFKVGDTVPLMGTIFPKSDGSAWEFLVVGLYHPLKVTVDNRTVWFRFDYLHETLLGGSATGPVGVGLYAVNVAQGHPPAQVVADIDHLFENGPQVTITATEAAWNAGFMGMMGSLPLFVATIGGAVVFAVFFSVVNTMLMSARQRVHEVGILKALGFRDGALARLMLGESLLLTLLGGGIGVGLAWISQPAIQQSSAWFANYTIEGRTAVLGLLVTLVIGVVAGLGPAGASARLAPTAALRSEG